MINTQFNSLLELIKAFPDQDACLTYLEDLLWQGKPVSPFDSDSKVWPCKNHYWKCKNTGKRFKVTNGTIFHNTKIPLQKWFVAIWLVTCSTKGETSIQLAKDILVSQPTAWRRLTLIRRIFGKDELKPEMKDEVQMDETFVGGKNKNRHKDKKVALSQGRSFKDKTPVFGMMSEGKVVAHVIETTSAKLIQPIIFEYIDPGMTIITDEWTAYNGLGKYYDHQVVDHGRHQYVTETGYTTNAVEGFWSIVKKVLIGVHHRVTRKHLQGYINEIAFRFNFRESTSYEKFNTLLINL